jgi:hypothetical protein
MFDWFKKPDYSNVVKFPETRVIPIVPPKESNTPETIYSIGATAEGTHMTLKVGYSTLTMTKAGVQNLIEQLAVFRDQLREEE